MRVFRSTKTTKRAAAEGGMPIPPPLILPGGRRARATPLLERKVSATQRNHHHHHDARLKAPRPMYLSRRSRDGTVVVAQSNNPKVVNAALAPNFGDDRAASALGRLAGFPGKIQQGIESRLAADDEFLFKLIWEIVQDQVIIVFTVLGSCGLPMFWSPEQLANACLLHATAFFNDILLMYFLAPTADGAEGRGESTGLSHMFEPGNHTVTDRARCWRDKFCLYAPMGLATAVVSSLLLTNFFLKEPLNLFYLAKVGLVGFLHLGISSNTRYQMINGADVLYYRMLDKNTARGATIASRLVNQVAGGKLFLMLSSFIL